MRRSICPILLALLGLVSCGDPTDRPQDCSPTEYFDEARKLCFVCPAVAQPRCDSGCGIRVTDDARGCPVAECLVGDDCTGCGPTEYVDSTLQCVPCDGPLTCPDGAEPTRVIRDQSCTLTCP